MATTAEIHAVADRLADEGKTPTLAAVRATLGGGSFTTISEAMKLWKANRVTNAVPIREAAPAAVSERLAEVAAEVWTLALDLANRRLQAERDALDVARAEAEQGHREAVEAADTIGVELEASEQRGARMRAELDRLTSAHAAEVAKLTAELEAARAQTGLAREEAANLRGRLEATQAQAETLMRHIGAKDSQRVAAGRAK